MDVALRTRWVLRAPNLQWWFADKLQTLTRVPLD
jgi:hypothetical protein